MNSFVNKTAMSPDRPRAAVGFSVKHGVGSAGVAKQLAVDALVVGLTVAGVGKGALERTRGCE